MDKNEVGQALIEKHTDIIHRLDELDYTGVDEEDIEIFIREDVINNKRDDFKKLLENEEQTAKLIVEIYKMENKERNQLLDDILSIDQRLPRITESLLVFRMYVDFIGDQNLLKKLEEE